MSLRYLLDTNICIYLIGQKSPRLLQTLIAQRPGAVGIPAIVVAELQYGVFNSARPSENGAALAQFLLPLVVVPFDAAAAEAYGRLRADLRRDGSLIGSMDMLIAAQAIALPAILVTNNEREFSRIPGLHLENWV